MGEGRNSEGRRADREGSGKPCKGDACVIGLGE